MARFNVEQAGRAKSQFFGLPSPAAGITLATFWPFAQTPLYQHLIAPNLKQPLALAVLMVSCSLLMVSHIPYPVWPKPSLRSPKGIVSLVALLIVVVLTISTPDYFVFPFIFLYVIYGLVRAALLSILERRPEREPLVDEDQDDAGRPIEEDLNPKLVPFQIQRPRRRGGAP